jgi:two-component system, OmpR family, KDP operon response regulator KdpE
MARILVVEDEDALRRTVTLLLARRGHEIAEADGVEAAEEALAAAPGEFDLIVLDLNLPDRTGWDLMRDLARRVTPPAVIVITAVRPLQRRLDEFHPDGLLIKPFPIDALVRLIERVLGRSHEPAAPRG